MKGNTWAAVAAGNQVQAPASAVVPTSKKVQLSAIANNGQTSAAVKADSRSTNPSDAESDVLKKDATAGTKSIIVASPEKTLARKNNQKKNKSTVVSKPPDSIAENVQKISNTITPSVVGAARISGTSKKKKPSAKAAESTDGNSPVQLNTKSQTSGTTSSPPLANEISTGPTNKKNKNKTWKTRDKVNDAKKVVNETGKRTLEPSGAVNDADQHILESNVHIQSNNTTNADKLNVSPADEDGKSPEDTSIPEYVHVLKTTSEAARATDASIIEAPTLDLFPLAETEILEKLKPGAHAHINSDSTKISFQTMQDAGSPRARSVVARKRRTHYEVETCVASLGLPGISFDEFGVCIAPDAPDWVRGRVARRVYWLVSDFKEGTTPAEIDIATELELEKKEKTHFPPAVWDRLFMIEDRKNPISQEEYIELIPMMGEFGVKLAAGLVSDSPPAKVDDEVGEKELLDKVNNHLSLSLSSRGAECQYSVHQKTNLQQDRGDRDAQMPPTGFRLFSQEPPPSKPVVPGPQSSANAITDDHSYLGPFMLDPSPELSSLQEHDQNPPQHHRTTGRQLCHNFANGYCYYGPACHFVHPGPGDVKSVASPSQGYPQVHNQNPHLRRQPASTQPCRQHAKGHCAYGENCRYVHVNHDENQAVTGPYQQDSAYAVFDSSHSVSLSSNATGMTGRLDDHLNSQGQVSRASSRMSGNTNSSARLTPDSHGSTQGSTQGLDRGSIRGSQTNNPPQKNVKGGDKHKGGKKSRP
ncbi:hypothetical protein PMIN06_002425 [Paraphaeosphaeria minitans]